MIFIVVKNPIRAKYADEFPQLVAEFTEATRAEPGNISFDWYRSVDDPTIYLQVEAFADAAAGDAHVDSEHFRHATEMLPRLYAGPPEIVHVEVTDGWSSVAEGPGGSEAS